MVEDTWVVETLTHEDIVPAGLGPEYEMDVGISWLEGEKIKCIHNRQTVDAICVCASAYLIQDVGAMCALDDNQTGDEGELGSLWETVLELTDIAKWDEQELLDHDCQVVFLGDIKMSSNSEQFKLVQEDNLGFAMYRILKHIQIKCSPDVIVAERKHEGILSSAIAGIWKDARKAVFRADEECTQFILFELEGFFDVVNAVPVLKSLDDSMIVQTGEGFFEEYLGLGDDCDD